jgi:hypothetical protein
MSQTSGYSTMSPAQAVLWQFWWRNRWGFVLAAAYLLAAAAIIRLLPAELRAMSLGDGDRPLVADWLGMPCVFVLMHVLAVFCTSEGGLKESGFSQHTFVLPVTARTLVAMPMIAGCVTIAAVWVAIVLLVLRPAGAAQAPLAWPAAALVLGLAAMQVGSWMPLAQSWLRVAVVPAVIGTVLPCALILPFFLPEAVATAMLLAPLPVLYAVGVQAVAKARRGDAYDWRAWRRMVERIAQWRKPVEHPFSSADRAQLWFEMRAHGWILPLTVGVMILLMAPLLLLPERNEVTAGWRFLGIVLAMPTLISLSISGQFGRMDAWSDYPMSPFLAARPMTTVRLVYAKLCMCLAATLAASLLMLVGVLVLLVRPGFAAHVVEVAKSIGIGKSIAIVAAGAGSLIAITWLQMASNLWISLTGRAWFVNTVAFSLAGLIGVGTLGGLWIYVHEELHVYVQAAVPWLMRVLLVLKPIVALAVLIGLFRAGLIRPMHSAAMIGVWCLVAGGLWLAAWWLLPTGIVPLSTVTAGIVLLVPFSRLAGAPLALHWNRHR